jgi:hypothetical protein
MGLPGEYALAHQDSEGVVHGGVDDLGPVLKT